MRTRFPLIKTALPLTILLLVAVGAASQQMNNTLDLSWYTVDAGGVSAATGGGFTLSGTAGQPDAGRMTGGNFALEGGYWGGGPVVVGVSEESAPGPAAVFRLHPSRPNPFNPSTILAFELPESAPVTLEVFDIGGRRVRSLLDTRLAPGQHQTAWDGRDDAGGSVASGIYIARLRAGETEARQKLTLVR